MMATPRRSGRQGRVCPWCSWEEWDEVRRALLPMEHNEDGAAGKNDGSAACSTSSKGPEWAQGVVAAWRARGRVPVAVDATAEIMQIKLGDPLGHGSAHEKQLALAMALVRLVNGVSGALQKGVYAKSVASLAEQVGLPRILVDLRHEATHSGLPSLSVLSIAADQALDWLRENYWTLQRKELEQLETQTTEVARDLLDLSLRSSSDDSAEGSSTKRRRAELLKELVDFVPSAQCEPIARAVVSAVVSRPFRPRDAKGWRTFLAKVFKYWPPAAAMALEGCWQELRRKWALENQEEDQEEEASLRAFAAWLVGGDRGGRDLLGEEGAESEPGTLRSVYGMVIEGARLCRGGRGEAQANRTKEVLKAFFGYLYSRANALDSPTFEGLRVTDGILGDIGGYAGPDILVRPVEQKKTKKRPGEGEGEGSRGEGRPRAWRRCEGWTPCALGNLPSAANPNGTTPSGLIS